MQYRLQLLIGGKKPQRNVYVVSHNNKYLCFRMFRVKHGQAERETLFHMRSRSLNDSKIWMMTKYQSKQNKAPNPHRLHKLDCCKYHLSAMKSLRGLTMPPGQLRQLHPEQQPASELQPRDKSLFLVWGFFGCAGLCTQVLWQQLYASSSSRNYQGVILVSNRFNANYFFHLCSRRGLPWLLLEQSNHSTTNPYWGEERLQSPPFRTNSVTS